MYVNIIVFFGLCCVLWVLTVSAEIDGSFLEADEEKENCSKSRLQKCMNLLQAINKDHNLAFAYTDKELQVMCNSMNEGLSCVHDHATRCFEPRKRQNVYQLVTGAEDFMRSLCMKGDFREQYQIHVPCMKNLSTDDQICGFHYVNLIQAVDPSKAVDSTETIRRQCCAFHTYLLCVTTAAQKSCGMQAARFIEEYSYRTAGATIQTQCHGYVPGTTECNSSYLHVASSAVLFLIVSFVMIC